MAIAPGVARAAVAERRPTPRCHRRRAVASAAGPELAIARSHHDGIARPKPRAIAVGAARVELGHGVGLAPAQGNGCTGTPSSGSCFMLMADAARNLSLPLDHLARRVVAGPVPGANGASPR